MACGAWVAGPAQTMTSRSALAARVDLGCNFFRYGLVYGDGRSEKLLGEIVRANSGQSSTRPRRSHQEIASGPAAAAPTLDDCFPPEHIDEFVHSSLKNARSGQVRSDPSMSGGCVGR